MIDIALTEAEVEILISALEVVYQLEGLGFSEYEQDLALELQERLECAEDDYDELDFDE